MYNLNLNENYCSFFLHSGDKLAFVRPDAVQNQIRDSGDLDSTTHMNLSNQCGVTGCAKSNSKYIEFLRKYSVCELSSNYIIKLIDLKTIEEVTPKHLLIIKTTPINKLGVQLILRFYQLKS